MRTKRWTRSPNGKLLGVVTGFAEWRGFPVNTTRLLFLILALCTEIFPGLIIYLILALVLPVQKDSDWIDDKIEDAEFKEADNGYEDIKRKSEKAEKDFFDKERDWDERFKSGN